MFPSRRISKEVANGLKELTLVSKLSNFVVLAGNKIPIFNGIV